MHFDFYMRPKNKYLKTWEYFKVLSLAITFYASAVFRTIRLIRLIYSKAVKYHFNV